MKHTVFIIDIDTTIANNDHRASLLEKECIQCLTKLGGEHRPHCPTCGGTDHRISQTSWDSFLSPDVMRLDTPVKKAQDAIYRLRDMEAEFHFLTGRNEGLREVTEEWLSEHVGWVPEREELIMRKKEDANQAASIYKKRAFLDLRSRRGLEDCSFIFFEDDPFVFRMYSQYGLVIKCPAGWDHWCPEPESGHEPTWRR